MDGLTLTLKRIAKRPTYTIGRLYINGEYFCDTLEDTDRGLSQSLPASVNKAKKLKGRTAIPTGKYRITLQIQSPRFSKIAFYKFCNGYLPRLINVPAFDGVLIHVGNYAGYETFFKKIPISKNKQVLSVEEYVDVV